MTSRKLHDGRADGLEPLESLDLDRVHNFRGLLTGMGQTAFAGRQLGEAFDILLATIQDPDCRLVLTVSGAMTVAKQGKIICDMIDRGMVHVVVATGALIAHGLTESIGLAHYRNDSSISDASLYARGYNRIYDTLEMEANLNDVEQLVTSVLHNNVPEDGVWSSARLCRALGQHLDKMDQGPGILRSAYRQAVPVFIPAFTDSEIGLDVSIWAIRNAIMASGKASESLSPSEIFAEAAPFNPFLDLQHYAQLVASHSRWGIFTIGGGVPRNWAQQIGPYVDIANVRLGIQIPPPRFQYGVRICPEPVHWGGLSGCTYSEGISWGKFVPVEDGGRYAEVYADATLAWPLLMKAVFEELQEQPRERR